MTYGDMRRAITDLPVAVSSALLPEGWQGAYCDEDKVILIDRRLTYSGKRCTLVHELVHWWYGDDDCSNARSRQERRTRTQTALLLVDPMELAALERMYDDMWSIANELNVTTQVLTDYRQILSEHACIV